MRRIEIYMMGAVGTQRLNIGEEGLRRSIRKRQENAPLKTDPLQPNLLVVSHYTYTYRDELFMTMLET